MPMIARPQPDEFAPYYAGYIQRVPDGIDIFAVLSRQPDDLRALLQNVGDEQANARPAPGEWSIKEVVGHVCDTERVFAYRAMRVARGDMTALPGFDQDDYVRATDFNARTLPDLVDEFAAQRRANVFCFQPLTEDETTRRGTASSKLVSVRALLYMMAGHVLHHVESLQTTYGVQGSST
ncbi:MAG: DinB family protein [Anaerolineae bacterium]|nr:DinB family protein [Anaerolineae bacterium]